jgi:gas vesicle protein
VGARKDRESARAGGATAPRDEQLDLLTAALIGLAVGASATLLFRRGPRGHSPARVMVRSAGRGVRAAGEAGAEGAEWIGDRTARSARGVKRLGERLLHRTPEDRVRRYVKDAVEHARSVIDDTVEAELRDLRKAIRRRRKRLGL